MEKLYRALGDRIAFIGISQDDRGRMDDFVRELALSFPIAQDTDKSISTAFRARIPSHVLIDMQGMIRYFEPSAPDIKHMEKILK